MRYILDGHPRESVMNIISGCRYRNWVILLAYWAILCLLFGSLVLVSQIIVFLYKYRAHVT